MGAALAYTDSGTAQTGAVIVGAILVLMAVLIAVAVFLLVMRKPCPACRSRVPRSARVCAKCGREIAA